MEYSEDLLEKTKRLLDILDALGHAPATQRRLSLCGGTALNLLRSRRTPRLSEDLDFNFRYNGRVDWGIVRQETEDELKNIIQRLGYDMQMLRIQPLYNQGRFYLRYHNSAGHIDLIKIEIGYMRRFPVLHRDSLVKVPEHGTSRVMTPTVEELYANKFCTMFSRMRRRPNARDVFDVATISKRRFRRSLFVDVVMLETLLMNLDHGNMRFLGLEKRAHRELSNLAGQQIDIEGIAEDAETFSKDVLEEIHSCGIPVFQETFKQTGSIKLEMLHHPELINHHIAQHPQLLWLRQRKK